VSQKSSLQRVLEILHRLNQGKKLCVSQLAEHYEISDRSIQRDFKIIIEVFDDFLIKEGECYKGYKKVLLDELLQGSELMMLSNIVNVFDITDTKSLVSNETKKLIKKSNEVYLFKSKPLEKLHNKEMLQTIEHSIKFNKELKILYHGRYLSNQKLLIQPYKIVFSVGNFYLIAKNSENKELRKFRVSNIEGVYQTSKIFYKDKTVNHYLSEMQTLLANDASKDVLIRLQANKVIAKYFSYKIYLPSQKIIQYFENGDIEVEYRVNNFKEIEKLMIKWLPNIKILEPKSLNDFMQKTLQNKINVL